MLDRGMTADLLEEKLDELERREPKDETLTMAMRSAMRHLREQAAQAPYTAEEAAAFAGALQTGAEIACYLEERSYYKPEGCVVYAMTGDAVLLAAGGHMRRMPMDSYNIKWRLWSQYPGGGARNRAAWRSLAK